MSLKQDLNRAIGERALLDSRFYQAWSAGELPKSALAHYGEEYGKFIKMLPKGWETLDDTETVEEEIEHAELWDVFVSSLGMPAAAESVAAVEDLIRISNRLFSTPVTALGAMYAFEAQQPDTAASKLDGLRKYYPVSADGEAYFEVHAVNHHESEKLLSAIAELSPEDQPVAIEACREMSQALWDALEGIYDASGAGSLN